MTTEDPEKTCPQCASPRPPDAVECSKCGVVYDKWRPRQQIQANARLHEMSRQSQRTYTPHFFGTLLLVGVFVALYFYVAPFRFWISGHRFRYNLVQGQNLSYLGTLRVTTDVVEEMSGTEQPKVIPFDDLLQKFYFNQNMQGVQSDKSLVLFKSYGKAEIDDANTGEVISEVPGDEITEWNYTLGVLPTGKLGMQPSLPSRSQSNSTMDDLTYSREANIMNDMWRKGRGQLNKDQLMAAMAKRYEGSPMKDLYLRKLAPYAEELTGWTDGPKMEKPIEVPVRPRLSQADLGLLERLTFMEYPKDALKTGSQWSQQVFGQIRCTLFALKYSAETPFRVTGIDGDAIRVEWNTPVNFEVVDLSKAYGNVSIVPRATGTYKGSARINMKDGFISKLEGDFEIEMIVGKDRFKALYEGLRRHTAYDSFQNGALFRIHAVQKIERL